MAWSYSGNPLDNPRDQVRFLVGDTDQSDPLLQDGEINYLLAQYPGPAGVLNATIRACEALMAKFSRMVNESVGQVKLDLGDRIKNLNILKTAMIQRIATESIQPYAGAISVSDMIMVARNPDRPCMPMTLHEMENQQIAPWVSNAWLYGLAGNNGQWGGCGC